MSTFTYNLIDYISDEFKRFLRNPVDIKFDFFKAAELSDFPFAEDLLEAVEKQTGIPASALKEKYRKEIIAIAKEIAVNVEIIGFYSGFFKKLFVPTFKYELHDILPAGKELTTEIGDIFTLETYRFTVDFDKLSEYDKKEFFKSHSSLTPQGLLDFLGYNFRRFENAIYRAIHEIQGYEYFDFIDAQKELKYQLENQLPLKLSILAEK